ncbi:ABC transporter substrate-binding protein [Yinghuangia soli]|uniref:ABC transporter substrate-binding protein n=1 Tax=Yinghuangia soli TaxID=2908204 RepID=A0AA41Q9Q3_9ACTN|nr:ABC transporter substrate-binding protein [Yinghuangia soli]MCF2532959.1 ABC transporter substrate-binding protein [Yinghuangia soli]
MNPSTRRRRSAAALLVVAALGITTACSEGGDKGPSNPTNTANKPPVKTENVIIGTAADSKGPAAAVPGAKPGGTVNVLHRRDFAHLDPARAYVSDQSTMGELFGRRLTFFKKVGDKTYLVGDLATDTGTSTDGGKTWKYTLKDNVKYQDGTPIKAADIKYAVERSFYQKYNQGPKWIQEWISGDANYFNVYEGPYGGKELGPDKIEVVDDKTIIFKLAKPHPDFPFAASMGTTVPVPKDKDTKEDYDKNPWSSGPYKITEHTQDQTLTLAKNEHWDPATDPIRHQYVDQFKFQLNVTAPQQFQRLTAAAGDDQVSFSMTQRVDAPTANALAQNQELNARATDGVGPYANYFTINNTRITDKQVRLALLTAFPREQARKAEGGPAAGEFSSSLASPSVLGWKANPNIFAGIPNTGDPAKAKQILEAAGKSGQTIVYCFATTDIDQVRALAIKEGLEAGGFKVENKGVSDKEYYDVIGKINGPCDLYWNGWGTDWPTAATLYTPVFDGRKIIDDGENYSHYNNPAVSAEIDRILAITDSTQQGEEFAKLDAKIMEDVPVIPYIYQRHRIMFGPKIGGVTLNVHGGIDLHDIYVK